MTKAVIYARVSTSDQDVSNQLIALEGYARSRDLEIIATYQEEESAWKAGHQKELAKLIKDARAGKFQVVLVWALDRLSREGSLAILSLVARLGAYKVKVISHQEPWTEAPGELQEILLSLAGWVARMSSQRISERTKAGLVRRAKEGNILGRPPGSADKKKRKRRKRRRQ